MNIAYTIAPGRGDTDLLLFGVAEALMADGFRPSGIVQINTEMPEGGICDMDVRVLPDGPIIRISQTLGREARGCRLNPEALENSVVMVQDTLSKGADCLIVNKFGKHEADGRGFRPVIAEALEKGIPVLVGLNRMNAEQFHAFTDGMAVEVAPDAEAILAWLTPLVTPAPEAV